MRPHDETLHNKVALMSHNYLYLEITDFATQ